MTVVSTQPSSSGFPHQVLTWHVKILCLPSIFLRMNALCRESRRRSGYTCLNYSSHFTRHYTMPQIVGERGSCQLKGRKDFPRGGWQVGQRQAAIQRSCCRDTEELLQGHRAAAGIQSCYDLLRDECSADTCPN